METRLKVSGRGEPLKKRNRAAKRQSGNQKMSNFSACKAQTNQHEIRVAFFERDNQGTLWSRMEQIMQNNLRKLLGRIHLARFRFKNVLKWDPKEADIGNGL